MARRRTRQMVMIVTDIPQSLRDIGRDHEAWGRCVGEGAAAGGLALRGQAGVPAWTRDRRKRDEQRRTSPADSRPDDGGCGVTGPDAGTAGPGRPAAGRDRASETVVIDARFCGPPGTGNGGYVAGLLAARLGGAAEITLRLPPPVATPLEIEAGAGQSVSLVHGPDLIAEGIAGGPDGPVPAAVSLAEARAAGAACRLRAHPEEHPYPGCFVCGPDRGPGDGLGIMVGPVAGRDLAADVWYPDGSLAGLARATWIRLR
jgi:hypothetical protein